MGTVVTRPYQALLDEAVALCRGAEYANLQRYWQLGSKVAEFVEASNRKKYGSRTIATLAEDLVAADVLSGESNVVRFLYWAQAVHQTYDLGYLENMTQLGFTLTHAKIMLSLSPEQRQQIDPKTIDANGRMISSRKLQELIKTELRLAASAEVMTLIGGAAEAKTATAAEDLFDPNVAGSPPQEPADAAPTTPAAAEPEAAPAETPARGATNPRQSNTSTPSDAPIPLKSLKQTEKVAGKLLTLLPEVVIVVGRRPAFDSDRAQHNYTTALASAKAAIQDLLEPLQETLRYIEEHESAT